MKSIKLFFLVYLFSLNTAVIAQNLPEGDGQQLVMRECAGCHGLNYITDIRRTSEQWEYLVSMMVSYGANLMEDEVETIQQYLTRNFGLNNTPTEPASAIETSQPARQANNSNNPPEY